MARIRTIKPEFPQSESMGRVSREARLLFVQLWTVCDDYGKARAHSRALASLLYPYDDDAKDCIDGWLAELAREKCIIAYVVGDDHYLKVCKWNEHQKIDRPSKSKFPDPIEPSRALASDTRMLVVGSGSKDLDLGSKDQGAVSVGGDDIWDAWREVGARHGQERTTALAKGVNLRENLATIRELVRDRAELNAALECWWASPFVTAGRNLGLFASALPEVLAHLAAGHTYAFRDPKPPAPIRPRSAWCSHTPECSTSAEHMKRTLDDRRAAEGIGPRAAQVMA